MGPSASGVPAGTLLANTPGRSILDQATAGRSPASSPNPCLYPCPTCQGLQAEPPLWLGLPKRLPWGPRSAGRPSPSCTGPFNRAPV